MSFNGSPLEPILAANRNGLPTMSYSSSSVASLIATKTDNNGKSIVTNTIFSLYLK